MKSNSMFADPKHRNVNGNAEEEDAQIRHLLRMLLTSTSPERLVKKVSVIINGKIRKISFSAFLKSVLASKKLLHHAKSTRPGVLGEWNEEQFDVGGDKVARGAGVI